MKKTLLLMSLLTLPFIGVAQQIDANAANQPGIVNAADNGIVSISAKGSDIRDILHSLFTQSKKNYVLEPGIRFALYLNLEKVDFDEALMIVAKQANLKFDVQNGIYYVGKAPAKPATVTTSTSTSASEIPTEKPVVEKPKVEKPKGTLPTNVLAKHVTTRYSKTDIRTLFADLAKQTEITIEVDKSVPNFKLDAYLINTSLKYGLDHVTEAAGLAYRFTQNLSIEIYRPQPETNRVSIVANDK